MLHCTTLSVHSSGGREGVGGGVMEDGGHHTRVAPASSSAHRKASSLPGHYSWGRSHLHHQPSFREAFNTSKSPTPPVRSDAAPTTPPRRPTSPRTPRAVAVPTVPLQQHHHHHQQQQQQLLVLQQQKHQGQINLQQYHKQQQLLLQQELHQKQMQQQLEKQQLWQQHQQQQQHRLHQESQRPHVHHQGKGHSQPRPPPQGTAKPAPQGRKEFTPPRPDPPVLEKKSKRSILSGIFRRRKKGSNSSSSSSSSSSSDSDERPPRRSFLQRRSKKKEKKDPRLTSPNVPATEERSGRVVQPKSTKELDDSEWQRPGESAYRRVRVVPSGTNSLGKEIQSLGIPLLTPQPGKLNRLGVSASHDSLPLSLGSWTGGGSHASLGYYSGGGMGPRSSSTDTISKKERREALKARVERLRERIRDTSSDDEKASVSSHSMYGSESSLSKSGSLNRRSRAARTERFLRRKSYELETLRNETEKDRRNREAVQARIEEIQRVREFEAKRNKLNEERKNQSPAKNKSRWSAKLVYQESSEYESSVLLRTPSVSPAASPHMKAKFNNLTKEAVVLRNKQPLTTPSVTVSLGLPSGMSSRRSFQDFEAPGSNTLRGHRSSSYDSNINRNSFVNHPPSGQTSSNGLVTNRSGLTPPPPPPRDKSRILSPGDGRPMSFSFESLNQDVQRPNSSQSSMSNYTKGSSPSPSVRSVPAYLGPQNNAQVPGPPPPLVPTRRSFSELELSQQQQMEARSGGSAPPARPAPPEGYPNTHYRYTDQSPRPTHQNHHYRQQQQQLNSQVQQYTDQSPQNTKVIPVSSIPPSPSSDYSSYMSDNSVKVQQANTAWRQKEKDIKGKVSMSPALPTGSNSLYANSRKMENTVMSSGRLKQQQQQQQDQGEGIYGKIETKKSRAPTVSMKQAESLSSLSGQSDLSSPAQRGPDSDSSQGSLARDKKKAQARPLSMVMEKAESGDKETPPSTTKSHPQPPVRGTWQPVAQGREAVKLNKMEDIKHKLDLKVDKSITHKEVEDMFKKEKEILEKSKCSNFEEALKELEEIYASLKLDSEDLMDGAERRDLPTQHQALRCEELSPPKDPLTNGTSSLVHDRERSRSLSGRRSVVPDVKSDDLHFRRCQKSSRNQPDVQKALQMTGSYLLVSPAHLPPSDFYKDLPKDPMMEGEPDIVHDDVSYRNIKQANAIKVIDPQPPFGIPLGPTTQASSTDYLHVTPKENYRPTMTSRKEPDTTMDDLAFRKLRKDKGTTEVNLSELDEFLCESRGGSPRRRGVRSASADRAQTSTERGTKQQSPRKVKHLTGSRRGAAQKESMTDSEATTGLSPVSARHKPSWLERAHLVDHKWDLSTNNLSTSTETLTELSSSRAVSQPDIRQAIIREARAPMGGPQELTDGELHHVTITSVATPATVTLATITVPRLVKVHTVHSAPASPVILESKSSQPLDSIFNNKAKPFYLSNANTGQQLKGKEKEQQLKSPKKHKHQHKREQQHMPKQEQQKTSSQQQQQQQQQQQDQVDIAKLDALISTISKVEAPDDTCDTSDASLPNTAFSPLKSVVNDVNISEPSLEKVPEPQTISLPPARKSSLDYEYNSAKANVKKAIRLSMALESFSSEGKEACSRRRSAVDLPFQERQTYNGSTSSSSSSSTNILSPLSLNQVSGGSGSDKVDPQPCEVALSLSTPAKASTCTDRVESMVVVSQQVHGRARRSRSVPTSPRTLDKTLDKSLAKPLINEDEVSTDGEEEHGLELEGVSSSSVSASLTLPGQGGYTHSLPSSSSVSPESTQPLSDQNTSTNQSTFTACDAQTVSHILPSAKSSCEYVDSESRAKDTTTPSATKLSSTKAPPPPMRLSSLPPTSGILGGPASRPPSGSLSPALCEESRAEQQTRGASEPRQQEADGESQPEGRTLVGAVLGPPTLRSCTEALGLEVTRGLGGAAAPHSCAPGEGGECVAEGEGITCLPSLVAACYLIACVTQLAGVDLMAALGLLLAMASVIITFAR